jgi:hypothetical protein
MVHKSDSKSWRNAVEVERWTSKGKIFPREDPFDRKIYFKRVVKKMSYRRNVPKDKRWILEVHVTIKGINLALEDDIFSV